MCGLAGFAGGMRAGAAQAALRAMTAAIAHRGPDGDGHWSDDAACVHLGHRRLAIIDVAGGDQPMWDASGELGIVFNGEIYNHRALRAELEALGHRFRTANSDTEVLIHGWRAWGPDLFLRLNGMFALALYDRPNNELVLARDRFGEKPLYWHAQGGFFAFASELTAMVAHPLVPRVADERALVKFFAHGFFPAPNTALKNVRKLPAGHFLRVRLGASAEPVPQSYWRFEIAPDLRMLERPEAELAEELQELLRKATRDRLESEVPLGFLLSGGIDSTAIAAFAAKAPGIATPQTFAMGFAEASYDESAWARLAAKHIGSVHAEEICDLAAARDEVAPLLRRLDEPMADSSILPTFRVCRFARRSVTVALSGDGGDELFAGYDTFRALAPARLYHALVPRGLDPLFAAAAGLLPRSDANLSLDFKLRRALRGAAYPPELWNPIWLGALGPQELGDMLGTRIDLEDVYSEALAAWRGAAAASPVERTLEFYTRFYMGDGILTKTDRASMLNGLELRAPFLDADVAACAARLPTSLKLRGKTTKYLLRQALRGVVPDAILDRPKKGFGIPLAAWLRGMAMPPQSGATADAWFAARWREHAQGARDWRQALWSWMAVGYSPLSSPQAPGASAAA
jgi:asparagine synthase (glutamine-hydrolysing)